jgi:hypothetical protein
MLQRSNKSWQVQNLSAYIPMHCCCKVETPTHVSVFNGCGAIRDEFSLLVWVRQKVLVLTRWKVLHRPSFFSLSNCHVLVWTRKCIPICAISLPSKIDDRFVLTTPYWRVDSHYSTYVVQKSVQNWYGLSCTLSVWVTVLLDARKSISKLSILAKIYSVFKKLALLPVYRVDWPTRNACGRDSFQSLHPESDVCVLLLSYAKNHTKTRGLAGIWGGRPVICQLLPLQFRDSVYKLVASCIRFEFWRTQWDGSCWCSSRWPSESDGEEGEEGNAMGWELLVFLLYCAQCTDDLCDSEC